MKPNNLIIAILLGKTFTKQFSFLNQIRVAMLKTDLAQVHQSLNDVELSVQEVS